MVERDGFDELLNSAADLALVAPGVYACDIWYDGGEEVGDCVEAGLVFLGDFGWEGFVDCADALEGEDSEQVRLDLRDLG